MTIEQLEEYRELIRFISNHLHYSMTSEQKSALYRIKRILETTDIEIPPYRIKGYFAMKKPRPPVNIPQTYAEYVLMSDKDRARLRRLSKKECDKLIKKNKGNQP